MRGPWEFEDPACVGLPTDYFFPEDSEGKAISQYLPILKKICGGCPHLRECRDWALAHEDFGYWGGTSAKKREEMRKGQRIPLRNISASRPNQTRYQRWEAKEKSA